MFVIGVSGVGTGSLFLRWMRFLARLRVLDKLQAFIGSSLQDDN